MLGWAGCGGQRSGERDLSGVGKRGPGVFLPGLRRHRYERGLTIADLEAKSGVAFSTISRLENGKQGAQMRTVRRLADTLRVEIADLMRE